MLLPVYVHIRGGDGFSMLITRDARVVHMYEGILNIISKIGKKETDIINKVFVSPVCANTTVATHVDGIIFPFTIPKTKDGWYRIQPIDNKKATIIDEADLSDREKYLKYLGKLRLVIVKKIQGTFYGVPDKVNKFGFRVNDLLPILLCDETPLDFDRVITRFDGANIWFDQVDQGNDPTKAEYLRHCLAKITIVAESKGLEEGMDPANLSFSGLTLEEKIAFTLRLSVDKKLVVDSKKVQLKKDVEFAGGSFVGFAERADHYGVTYRVNGSEFTSYVSKDRAHSVISAGLCLNGNDNKFDLKSLITVIREGHQKGLIHNYHLRT